MGIKVHFLLFVGLTLGRNPYFCLFINGFTMPFFDNLFTIASMDDTESGFTARLRCNPSHPVYQAHFPGNPITPGACLVQTACDVLQKKLGRPLSLKASKSIKFLNQLVPAEGREVSLNYSHLERTETECKTQVVIADESTVFSKMSLTFSYESL